MSEARACVLLVDDEPEQIELYRYGLEQEGFVVTAATDGRAAIAQAQSANPDAIVLDLRMPDIDGWQVCAHLKSDSRTSRIPIVILTAAASPALGKEVERAKCAAFLIKPCYPSDLASTLRAVMRAEPPKFGV